MIGQPGCPVAYYGIVLLLLTACGGTLASPTPAAHAVGNGNNPTPPDTYTTPQASDSQIGIANFTFAPTPLTISVGTAVTWTNHDDIPHTVMSTDKRFASAALDTDDGFAYRFATPGIYNYYCTIHPKMLGTIIVQ